MNEATLIDKFYTYRYISDFAVITFVVSGYEDWNEEMFDSVANDDLATYVKEPEAFWLDDCWEMEKP